MMDEGFTVTLSGLSEDITYSLVVRDDEDVILYDEFSIPEDSSLTFGWSEPSLLSDDGGTFRVAVSSLGGASCLEPYTLTIDETDLF